MHFNIVQGFIHFKKKIQKRNVLISLRLNAMFKISLKWLKKDQDQIQVLGRL